MKRKYLNIYEERFEFENLKLGGWGSTMIPPSLDLRNGRGLSNEYFHSGFDMNNIHRKEYKGCKRQIRSL